MSVEIGTQAAQFLFGEYTNRIFFAVQVSIPVDPKLNEMCKKMQRESKC